MFDDYIQQTLELIFKTDLYYEDGDYFYVYKVDGQYVSKDKYDTTDNRFAEPDEAYKCKPATCNNPIS